jgi:hypothetical protein
MVGSRREAERFPSSDAGRTSSRSARICPQGMCHWEGLMPNQRVSEMGLYREEKGYFLSLFRIPGEWKSRKPELFGGTSVLPPSMKDCLRKL